MAIAHDVDGVHAASLRDGRDAGVAEPAYGDDAMPIPMAVGHFNQHVTNRILAPIVRFLPFFGTVEHVGRRTGELHRSPMMVFPLRPTETATFALTYGPRAYWVQNALAAGEVTFESRWAGRLHLVEPRVVHDPRRRAMPWLVRQALRMLRVADFLEARVAPER
jgi:deazaflavin-dependent oxidoreductase (nitroreductase family)